MNKITMYSPYQGCSFGERCNPADFSINGMNILAVLTAKKANRPVKLLFDRSEKFYGESGDMMVSYFKVGAKKDGTITAVDMKNIFAVFQCTPGDRTLFRKHPNSQSEMHSTRPRMSARRRPGGTDANSSPTPSA